MTMKKEYIKPDMMVVKLQPTELICYSPQGNFLVKGMNSNLPLEDAILLDFNPKDEVGRAVEFNMNIITWDEW